MNIIWARALASLLAQGALAILLGLIAGVDMALGFAIVVLLVQGIFNTYHTQRLWRLLDAPVYGEVPSAPGLWGEIYFRLHKLAKRWHAQVRQVEQQHLRFIQGIQASPNGVLMLDDQNQIEWCNAIAEEHFGLDARRDLRQHITYLVRQPGFVRYLNSQQYDEALQMRGMGEDRQHVLSVQLFPYGDNRKLVLTHDITELERTDAMRRDFVANVSHELKTPLTVLAGFLETLSELPLSDQERRRYLEIMSQQAARMQTLVNDLLTLAALEREAKPPVEAQIDMEAVLRQLQTDVAALSNGRHHITIEADPTLTMRGAEVEITSAFANLVSNAVRYTPDGGSIHLNWGLVSGCPVFSVTDTGFGIPPDQVPRLTERFYRVDRSRSRDTGGTGLGLAIVKHVLQRHDGHLDVVSEEGQGSTFAARFAAPRALRRPAASTAASKTA